MISKEQIRSILTQIATDNNLNGESVDLMINELTYSLYHEQFEITNAIQESNLSTATLMNSKIRNCMNVMYSVYRGKNPRVRLKFKSNTRISLSKFDRIYSSNTFKIYAANAYNIGQTIATDPNDYPYIDGILTKTDLIVVETTINSDNKYFLDVALNRRLLSNISEDIQVFINGVEYPITRNFFDHIQQTLPLKEYDAYDIETLGYYVWVKDSTNNYTWVELSQLQITNPNIKESDINILGSLPSINSLPTQIDQQLDSIYVLTIPDYGIRLFKRGYFNPSDTVIVKALQYTTLDEINSDEFSKISIPGTELIDAPLNIVNTISKYNFSKSGAIREVERANINSLLYNANLYGRLQSRILSKSDINALFSEYFISMIRSAINWYVDAEGNGESEVNSENFTQGNLMIYYVPIVYGDKILDDEIEEFKSKYGSYFISTNLITRSGIEIKIHVNLDLYVTELTDLSSDIGKIFDQYSYILNDPSGFSSHTIKDNVLKPKQIFADISKLQSVDFIDSISYVISNESPGLSKDGYSATDLPNDDSNDYRSLGDCSVKLPPLFRTDPDNNKLRIPTYYTFDLNITYKSSHEIISR